MRSTTAELSDKLFSTSNGHNTDPAATSQHEPSSQTANGNSNWYEAYKEGVHGIPVQELLEALSNGQLPDALHDKLYLSLKDGDETWEGSVASMRNNNMLREKFSRQMNELKRERDRVQAESRQFMSDLEAVKGSPEQFLHAMQGLGMPVLEAAKILATRYATRDFLNKQAGIQDGQRGPGDEWLDGIQAQQEVQALRNQQTRQNQAQQKQREQQIFEQRSHAVQNAAMEAFKNVGIDPVKYPQYWDRASQHLQRIYDHKPEPRDGSDKPLTKSDVREAVRLVKEEIDNFMRGQNVPVAGVQEARPGAARLDNGAPKNVPDRAPKPPGQRKTTDEIAREMRERAGVRIR